MWEKIVEKPKIFFFKVTAIFMAIFTAATCLKEFGLVDIGKLGIKGFCVMLLISMIIAVMTLLTKNKQEGRLQTQEAKTLIEKLNNRMGTLMSSETIDEEVLDKAHSFDNIFRQDLLNYTTGDYHSIRILKGKNVEKRPSMCLVYCESTDSKTSFNELVIKAIDLKTGKELSVQPIGNRTAKVYTHKFKIEFASPIANQKDFEIAYYIKIPDELKQLSEDEEVMSITLKRILKDVQSLEFNICLNFEPRCVNVFKFYGKNKGAELLDMGCQAEQYIPTTDIEKHFDINWGEQVPYIIRTSYIKPDKNTYIIQYKK